MTAGPVTARDTFVQALADIQLTGEHTRDLVAELRKIVQPAHAPAELRLVKLTEQANVSTDAEKRSAKSFTIVNPAGFAVRFGVGGIGATNVAAFPVPAKSVMTVPTSAEFLELGAHPDDLLDGDVYLFVFLYDAPQAFFLGGWPG